MAVTARLRIDPTRCRGHAICVLFCSDAIDLDRWGYGRVVEADITDAGTLRRARRAAAACPNHAVVVTGPGDGAGVDRVLPTRGLSLRVTMGKD